MSNIKHTPGEWIETAGPEAKYWLVGVPNNNGFSTIATISATIDGTSLANAKLIAQSPVMYTFITDYISAMGDKGKLSIHETALLDSAKQIVKNLS